MITLLLGLQLLSAPAHLVSREQIRSSAPAVLAQHNSEQVVLSSAENKFPRPLKYSEVTEAEYRTRAQKETLPLEGKAVCRPISYNATCGRGSALPGA